MMSHYLLTTTLSPALQRKQFSRAETMRSSVKQVREALWRNINGSFLIKEIDIYVSIFNALHGGFLFFLKL